VREIELLMDDDGCGFKASEANAAQGMG